MRIYIASSYRNLHLVQLLTSALEKDGHIVEDWTKLAPPLPDGLIPDEAKALLDSDNERGEIFEFCTEACTHVDLLIYVGPAGQDAACEVGLAASSGVPVFGLAGPLERPGLILSGLATWFASAAELLQAVNGDFIRKCRVCGCTHYAPCVDDLGATCWWVAEDLCSACSEQEAVNE